MTHSPKLHVATILGPHGVRGLVKVASLTDDPAAIFAYAPLTDESGSRVFTLARHGAADDPFIAAVEGVETREASEKLKGQKLFIDRAILPQAGQGEYYLADLIGLEARDASGTKIGKVEATHDYGAGLFIEIKPEHASSFMLPFKEAFVPQVDLAKGFLTVALPEGWGVPDKKKPKARP